MAFVLLRRQQREGSILPPLQSNHEFAVLQMKGDAGGGLGELPADLPSSSMGRGAPGDAGAPAAFSAAGPQGAPPTKQELRARRSTQNGRAAAMKAKREGKI